MASIERKRDRLTQIFAGLEPARDFHILALEMELFLAAGAFGDRACLPVAELNVGAFSNQVIARNYGGLCGQYLLLNGRLVDRHHASGQQLGTGFVSSRFCFYRELNRGVDWIFTNQALKLGAIRERLLGRD